MKADFYSVDRFENGFAVCEGGDGKFILIPIGEILYEAREGDVLVKSGGGYVKDEKETEKRRREIAALLKEISGK